MAAPEGRSDRPRHTRQRAWRVPEGVGRDQERWSRKEGYRGCEIRLKRLWREAVKQARLSRAVLLSALDFSGGSQHLGATAQALEYLEGMDVKRFPWHWKLRSGGHESTTTC